MTFSLRRRLVVGIAVLMTCGLVVANVAGVALLRSYLMQRVDDQLSFGVEDGRPPPIPPGFEPCDLTQAGAPGPMGGDFVITVVDRAGVVQCRLPEPGAQPDLPVLPTWDAASLAEAATEQPRTVPGTGPDGAWRIRVVPFADGYVIAAVSLTEARATVHRMTIVAALIGAATVGLAALGATVMVRRWLRPLTAIELTAEAIAGGDLSRRVEAAPVNTEVGRLAASLNAMLTQIEEAFLDRAASQERLREFVADASHELRTPLATIRGHAELYRHGMATTPGDVARLLSRIESESLRMGALVEDLLLLARMDAAPSLDLSTVDLLSVAADAVMDANAQDPTRPVGLRPMSGDGWLDAAPVVRADEARVRQILGNLLSNALRHTPPGSPVEVEVGVRAQVVRVQVVDHGPGLPAEIAERVFERFYRGDPGRVRSRGGAGLGLSIVQSLVDAHHGSVRHQPTPGGGSTFTVDLPTPPVP